MLLYILHPPLCSCRAGIPTLTLKVYHNFIKTFHGFVLGRVSTSPPKSCLAVPKVEITWTPKLWSMQLHKSMMILWKVDWMYFWGFKKCVQKYWDDLYLYWISCNHWTKAFRYCNSGLCVSENAYAVGQSLSPITTSKGLMQQLQGWLGR